MIVKLMICSTINIQKHEDKAHENLKVRQDENKKDKSFEIQLFVCFKTEGIRREEKDESESIGKPVSNTTFFRAEVFEGKFGIVFIQRVVINVKIKNVSDG